MKIRYLKQTFFLSLVFFQSFLFAAEQARKSFVRPGAEQVDPEKATGSRPRSSAIADRRSVCLSGAALDGYDVNLDNVKKITTALLEKKLPKNIFDAMESFYNKIKKEIKSYGKVVEYVAHQDDEINKIVTKGIVLIFNTFDAKKDTPLSKCELEILDGELTSCLMNIKERLDYIKHQEGEVEKQFALFGHDHSKLKASYTDTFKRISISLPEQKRAGSVSDIFTIKFKIIEARKAIDEAPEEPSFFQRMRKKITGDEKEVVKWVSSENYLL